jgi:hypothetical protein
MNTPIYNAAVVEHFMVNALRMPPEYESPPTPTRFDAELVVAGIEGRATVSAGMQHHLGVRL